MQTIMTITLSSDKPVRLDDGEYTTGQEATIFQNDDGTFGYRYHGVNYRGQTYESTYVGGFQTKQAAIRDALEKYNIGTGC
jgi:hypothetical protein